MAGQDFDPVSRPRHYNTHPSGVECIEVSRHLPGNLAAAFKYLYRYRYKGRALEDLRKAAWYLRDQAANCEPFGSNVDNDVVAKAIFIANHESDWRICEAMKRTVLAYHRHEYDAAADLVDAAAMEIDEQSSKGNHA